MSKRGRLSHAEEAFIIKNAPKLSVAQIAVSLDRTTEVVRRFMAEIKLKAKEETVIQDVDIEQASIKQELRNSFEWQRLKQEFTAEEIKLFEEKFVLLMSQFQNDVLSSEITQIMLTIKFEILMSRNLMARRQAIEDIGRLHKMQKEFLEPFGGDPNQMDDAQKQFALSLETQLQAAKSAEQARTTEYTKLHTEHQRLMKDIKGTRDQRIKDIESGKVTVLGLIKMLQQQEAQIAIGREMELTKMAAAKEYQRLGHLHKYEDGSYDRPILSADTVDLEG